MLDGLRLSVLTTYLACKAEDMPGSVVVLDEFPYLAPPRRASWRLRALEPSGV